MGLLATPEDFAQMMLRLKKSEIVRVTIRAPWKSGEKQGSLTRYGAVIQVIKSQGRTSLQCRQMIKTAYGFRVGARNFTVFDTQLETLSLLA